jgi:hypothetical protein
MRMIERPPSREMGPPTEEERARAARLEEWTRALAKPRHFREQADQNARVRSFIASFLGELGYSVTLQGRYENVVALPRDRRNLLLVGAHYDSVPQSAGADDNASGVAVLLAVASALARGGPPPGVGFVAFNAEEDGLLGSADFVASGRRELGLEVAGIHVLEMVGFSTNAPGSQRTPSGLFLRGPDRGNFLGLLSNGRSGPLLARAFEKGASATPDLPLVGLETRFGIERWLPVLLLSDHAPFWRAGIPALLWTDTAFFRNPHYHDGSDTPATLDYGFMDRIAALVTASVAP